MSRLKQWQLCSQLAAEAERIAGGIRAVLAGDDGPANGWADVARDLVGVVAELERIEEHHDLLPEEAPVSPVEETPPAARSATAPEAIAAGAAPRASAAPRPARQGRANSGLPSSEAMEARRRMVRYLADHGASKPSAIEQAVGMPPRLRIGDALSHRWFQRVGHMLWDLTPAGRSDAGLAPSVGKGVELAPSVRKGVDPLSQRTIRLIGERGPQRTGRLVEGLGVSLKQVLAVLESGLFEEQADGWHLSDAGAAELRGLRESQTR
jgi:hypothetical protein